LIQSNKLLFVPFVVIPFSDDSYGSTCTPTTAPSTRFWLSIHFTTSVSLHARVQQSCPIELNSVSFKKSR
jgi:hypothetical protein